MAHIDARGESKQTRGCTVRSGFSAQRFWRLLAWPAVVPSTRTGSVLVTLCCLHENDWIVSNGPEAARCKTCVTTVHALRGTLITWALRAYNEHIYRNRDCEKWPDIEIVNRKGIESAGGVWKMHFEIVMGIAIIECRCSTRTSRDRVVRGCGVDVSATR